MAEVAKKKLPGLPNGFHTVYSIQEYVKKTVINGVPHERPMVAINRSSASQGIHLTLSQLESKKCFNPQLLFGKEIEVTFFEKGETLMNGNVVEDSGMIVKDFVIPPDMELERQIALNLAMKDRQSLSAMAKAARAPRVVVQNKGTEEEIKSSNPADDIPDDVFSQEDIFQKEEEKVN